jgi:hypothetical protein
MVSYEDISSKLIEKFPELREKYEKELEWWSPDKPGEHIVFGDFFTPYLVELLETGRDSGRLERAFGFLDCMISSDDAKVREVAVVTVLEYLQGKPDLLTLAEPYLGPLATTAVRDLDEFWQQRRQRVH